MKIIEVSVKLKVPIGPDEETKKLGWTYDYEFIKEIADMTDVAGEFVDMEGVEAVINAIRKYNQESSNERTTT